MNIAIIGAGAAGLMAAITLREHRELDVSIYEAQDEAAKKIVASGNGKCNITNVEIHADNYVSSHSSFVKPALSMMSFKKFQKFCMRAAIPLQIRDDAKCYPLNLEARYVRDALVRYALHLGVKILFKHKVLQIKKEQNHFKILLDTHSTNASYLIIATGLSAAPQLGGSDSTMIFAKSLNHATIAPAPALVGLHTSFPNPLKMSGVKIDALVDLVVDSSAIQRARGDLLFTKYGISGLTTLDLSTRAAIALKEHKVVKVKIDLLPNLEQQQIVSILNNLHKAMPDLRADELIQSVLPKKLSPLLLQDIEPKAVDRKLLTKLAHKIKSIELQITDTHGFRHAEAASGGVSTEQINSHTMESTIVKRLYFIGEGIDVVGDRGGYNFAWCWASGYSAALSILAQKE